jgi:hypothetical protein
MRHVFTSLLLFAVTLLPAQDETAPDSLGLPGDNFDLYGALDLFKASASLEEFETKLNDPANEVNNLDLDEDGNVDYISVNDNMDGDAHAIILQVAISETESQAIAAIEIEKTGTDAADLQIVGDEELYGDDYIVEPETEAAPAQQKWGEQNFDAHVIVNVWMWPAVRFVYAPGYVVWVSPWHYRHYPAWYKPWKPVGWAVHHRRVARYRAHHHYCHAHRMARAHVVYAHHRRTSAAVHQRNAPRHAAYKQRKAAHAKPGGHPAGKGGPKGGKPVQKGGGGGKGKGGGRH